MRRTLPLILQNSGIFFLVDSSKIVNIDSTSKMTRQRHHNIHKGFGGNALHVSDIMGTTIACVPLMDGRGHDGTQYRQSAMFQQEDGISWDNDETGLGDSHYVGRSNRHLDSMHLAKRYTDAEINAMPPCQQECAIQYNASLNTLRSSIETNIGSAKRNAMYGDLSKQRISLHTHPEKVEMYNHLSIFLDCAKGIMRGQYHASNPAVLTHGFDGIDVAQKIINEETENLYTVAGYSRGYYGARLSGRGVFPPPPLPLSS
jgi:hypothetical protein